MTKGKENLEGSPKNSTGNAAHFAATTPCLLTGLSSTATPLLCPTRATDAINLLYTGEGRQQMDYATQPFSSSTCSSTATPDPDRTVLHRTNSSTVSLNVCTHHPLNGGDTMPPLHQSPCCLATSLATTTIGFIYLSPLLPTLAFFLRSLTSQMAAACSSSVSQWRDEANRRKQDTIGSNGVFS